MDFIFQNTNLDETTHYARALMALKAVGYKGIINGVNLEEKIISFQKDNGHFAQYDKGEQDLINAHVWSILALAATEREIPQKDKARTWLLNQQNIDGGFGWAVGGESDPDSTGVALNALAILGERPGSSAINRAIKYLNNHQEEYGGISSSINKANSASNAWAIQGLLAIGENPEVGQWNKNGKSPFSYLKSLQNSQGYFEWTEGRQVSPVLMTAYGIMAMARKPFPVNIDLQSSCKIVLTIGQKEAHIGNNKVSLDAVPKIIQGSTMVPLRFIAESLGANTKWNQKTQKVEITKGNNTITLTPPLIEGGRTFVPVRYISESLGAKVTWYADTKKIEIIAP
jgi:prenyltransferase beta subunit